MNEDESNVEEQEVSTDNISAEDGGETTTPEEVAKITGKPVVTANDDAEDSEDAAEDDEESDDSEDEDAGELADDDSDDTEESDEAEDADESENADDSTHETSDFELDVEDANGNKFTLKPGDDIEKALEDFEPKNNGQIMKVLYDFQKLEAAKNDFDEKQAAAQAEADRKAGIAKIQQGWDNEIKQLQSAKRLPVSADGKQSDRVKDVFKFMSEENDKREKDGRPLIGSFEDALDKFELNEVREKEKEEAKKEKDTARKKGGIVGGSSAPVTSSAPVYKGGARNAVEAARQMGVL